MALLNTLITLLYLSLLLTTDASHAHDQRLSPLADSQYQAINAHSSAQVQQHAQTESEQDEPSADINSKLQLNTPTSWLVLTPYATPWLRLVSRPNLARAPPVAHHA